MSHELTVTRESEWYVVHKVTGAPRKRWRHHQWLYLTRSEAQELMMLLSKRLSDKP